ncbi:uncharacterized protein LOC127002393 isoform X1 [Eriocheir sinensis]|uniref:uncharacterized protein LOC127002393 isoform X1 n=1 Tax=Eriocheir sinensis TaxID=95602 RepID=UPI0021C887A5|nr:uncharacterized protein LOC127002393 isoform X1 [Eriocheir sinensis]
MFSRESFPPQGRECPRISRHEAQVFITEILNEDLPLARPPSLPWINRIIQAFHKRLPFQNITFLSKTESCCVPSWEEIRTDVLKEGKGGLCLSLNVAFAAIVRAFGVLAYTVPADYVATSGRSVHVLTVFHKCSAAGNHPSAGTMHEVTSGRKDLRRSSRLKQKQLCECGVRCSQTLDSFPRNSLYVADVGCGFPTRKSINLCEDLGRPFVDCGLEYCFMNNGHKFLRLHRTGDDVPEGEQEFVNGEGWRPVFSFALTPQPLSYFCNTMRSVYVDKEASPYFTELHAVRYPGNSETIAFKATWSSQKGCTSSKKHYYKMEKSVKTIEGEVRKVEQSMKLRDIVTYIRIRFPMIPLSEVQRSVEYFWSLDEHMI